MSVQASSWVIKYSQHKGSALLLMLMIANHAHADGTNAFPGVSTLARECRMSERQIIRLLPQLEASGELRIEKSKGRNPNKYAIVMEHPNPDKLSRLETANPDKLSPLTLTTCQGSDDPNPDISGSSTLTSEVPNPDISGNRSYMHNRLNRPEKGRGRTAPSSIGSTARDGRRDHPAIAALREVTGREPPEPIWNTLIALIGSEPDMARLIAAWEEWNIRTYKPTNWGWVTDWYVSGIPSKLSADHPPSRPQPRFDPGRPATVADTAAPVELPTKPRRPPDASPPDHRRLWDGFRDGLRAKLHREQFSWFENLIFDGLNEDRMSIRLRGDGHVVEWIQELYLNEMHEILTSMGLGEFTFDWEIENELEAVA